MPKTHIQGAACCPWQLLVSAGHCQLPRPHNSHGRLTVSLVSKCLAPSPLKQFSDRSRYLRLGKGFLEAVAEAVPQSASPCGSGRYLLLLVLPSRPRKLKLKSRVTSLRRGVLGPAQEVGRGPAGRKGLALVIQLSTTLAVWVTNMSRQEGESQRGCY